MARYFVPLNGFGRLDMTAKVDSISPVATVPTASRGTMVIRNAGALPVAPIRVRATAQVTGSIAAGSAGSRINQMFAPTPGAVVVPMKGTQVSTDAPGMKSLPMNADPAKVAAVGMDAEKGGSSGSASSGFTPPKGGGRPDNRDTSGGSGSGGSGGGGSSGDGYDMATCPEGYTKTTLGCVKDESATPTGEGKIKPSGGVSATTIIGGALALWSLFP